MHTYRARSSTVWGWIAIGIGALVAVLHILSVGITHAHGGIGLGGAVALFGWAAFLRPHVAAGEDAVEIHNVTQTASVAYARLESLDTRWSLEAVGDDGTKVGAFAAPAPGARAARRPARPEEAESAAAGVAMVGRAGDRIGTPSGDAAAMVRARLDAWRAAHPDAAPAAGDASPAVVRRPDWIGIGAMTAGTALAIWGGFF
ncbi:hypothetical protein [Demequina soli]|uniref:hypothetical protein n=1 Tax=Demequina soli TaxID=1638987 RepID=UPI0007839BDA|nr:hypothetical protein [Demequina soli]